jgi:hypothetical protein
VREKDMTDSEKHRRPASEGQRSGAMFTAITGRAMTLGARRCSGDTVIELIPDWGMTSIL